MKNYITSLLFCLIITANSFAQTFILSAPTGYSPKTSTRVSKIFFNPTDSVVFTWSKNFTIPGVYLKIGPSPGNYNLASINVSSDWLGFIPANAPQNLSTGRYYCIITNSTKNTLSEIQSDYQANKETIGYSNESQFIVQAAAAPYAIAPRGTITNSTPVFQWNPVPGVPAYWIICSSTPFIVSSDGNNNISVSGANVVWDYITTGTSATYGQISPYSPFTQTAIPLFPGNQYNFTILNLFDPTDISFASSVFGGAVAFTLNSSNTIQAPNLISPDNNAVFSGTPTIRFQWDYVSGANTYTFHLFNKITQFAGNNQEIDIPIWSTSTTYNIIDFPAHINLLKGKYSWFVVPNSNSGSGSVSDTRIFNYNVPTGKYRVSATSSDDNSTLLNYQFQINSTTGGFSPALPIIVTNSSTYSDSIPADNYQFTVSKPGYFDSTFSVNIHVSVSPGDITAVPFRLRAFPVTVSGSVRNQANAAVSGANVNFTNLSNGDIQSKQTSSSGAFSLVVPKGQYTVSVDKPGYLSPPSFITSADSGQVLLNPIVLTEDNAILSGKVLNDNSEPIQLANLSANKGTVTQQAVSDASGSYSFNLSSGQWKVDINKVGFASPATSTINLTVGQNLQQNFQLVPRANQVTGFIYKLVTNIQGQKTSVPFNGVIVSASPSAGQTITTVSNSAGQYTLSLGSGAWSISVTQSGYTSGNPAQMTLAIAQTISGIDFTLTPNPSSVSGAVTDPNGAPVEGATISVGNLVSANSLSSGSYSLSLPSGSFSINAIKQGYVSPQPMTINLTPGQNLTGINFQLVQNAGLISGNVLSSGQPINNAVVTAVNGSSSVSVNTDQNGNYSLNVQPGQWLINVSKQSFITSANLSITIGAGQTSLTNNFNLVQNTALLTGIVKSGNTLINNAQILITEVNNPANSLNAVSDINGGFSVTVGAGKNYNLAVSKTGYALQSVATGILAPASTLNYNFNLAANPSSISGRIVNVLQNPLGSVKIYLTNSQTGAVLDSVLSDVNGNYIIGTSAGSFKLVAFKRGYIGDNITLQISTGQNVTNTNFILTENFALLTGNVKDNFGAPLQGVLINLSSPGGGATFTTSSSGDFIFSNLLGDNYNISISKTGYSDTIISNFKILDGETKSVNVVLNKLSGRISGQIFSGQVLVGQATVTAANQTNQIFSATTDNSGNYVIPNLNFGTYIVTASKTGYSSSQQNTVNITPQALNGTANINDFTLNNGKLFGIVKDKSNNPLLQASINITGSLGSGSTISGNDGKFTILNLAKGTYNLQCSKSGYSNFDTTNFVVTDSVYIPIILNINNSTIKGYVLNQLNQSLPFIASLTAVSNQGSIYTTTTDLTGYFEFNQVGSNTSYTISTQIFREGIVNDTVFSVNVPIGQTVVGPINITVKVNNSYIKGTVGISSALVKLTNLTTNEIKNISSSSTGGYQFGFMSNGQYRIAPEKLGFNFTPASKDLTLGITDTVTADFQSTSDIGNILVAATDNTGSLVSGVSIAAINYSSDLVFPGTTDSSGSYQFNGLPSGTYILKLSLSNCSVTPDSASVTVSNGSTVSKSFIVTKNTGSVSGKVNQIVNSVIALSQGATLNLRNLVTGQTFSTSTLTNGTFKLDNLSSGDMQIKVSKAGFISDSAQFNLAAGEKKTIPDLNLKASFVQLTGKVVYNNTGLSNVIVNAISSTILTDTTDINGNFSFENAQVKPLSGDTTIYQVKISGTDITPQSKIILITGSQVGGIIPVPQFTLPSGQISLLFSDLVKPVSALSVTVTYPNGQNSQTNTGNDGRFTSSPKLSSGTYKFSLFKKDVLVPGDSSLTVILNTDTSMISKTISLPFWHSAITVLNPAKPNNITVGFNVKPVNSSGMLYYKQKSSMSFIQTQMVLSDSAFTGIIPALFSLDPFTYYVQVTDNVNNIKYKSDSYSITPSGEGILFTITAKPDLGNAVIRKGDVINLSLTLWDGINKSLSDSFTVPNHNGHILWQLSDPTAGSFSFPVINDSTVANFTSVKEGAFKIINTVSLNGVVLTKSVNITVGIFAIDSITVTQDAYSIPNNKSQNYQFASTAWSGGKNVIIGNSMQWSVTPPYAGTIDQTGLFTPFLDSTLIGTITVTAQDKVTGFKRNAGDILEYATINASTSITLTDKLGMTLRIYPGSVNNITKISLSKPQFGPAKKTFAPLDQSNTFAVSDKQYLILPDADLGLRGDSLMVAAVLELPLDNSLRFFDGAKSIAYFDTNLVRWLIKPTTARTSNSYIFDAMYRFGEYAILSTNEPLGLKYVAVLPTPFSPQIASLKIGYFLTTNSPPANVTIKIFNVRGELVRTILDSSPQFAGRYGSRTGLAQIEWDGRTNDGLIANNGRYIIQINAKDVTGEKTEIKQIVLVK